MKQHIMPRWFRWAGTATFVLIVLALVVVPSGSQLYAEPAAPVTVSVKPVTKAVPVNGTFTMKVEAAIGTEMDATGGLGAYEFDFGYDKDYLEVIDVTDAGELKVQGTDRTVDSPPQAPVIDNANGQTAFAAYSYDDVNDPQDEGPKNSQSPVALADVTFNTLLGGVTTLDLQNVLLVDTQANAWPDGGSRNVSVSSAQVWIMFDAFFDGTYDDAGKRIGTDYDGDQTGDLAVWDPTSGKWYIKGSTGQNLFPTWGGPGLIPVPGDYDGDKVTDVGMWDPATGKWYIKMSGGQGFFPWWGAPGMIPVLGDYDGDRITDVAIWDPTTGKWYIKMSGGQRFFPWWGGPGNIPLPGDYDGDKITDIAVWNPVNGRWYIKGSTGQKLYPTWGGPGLIPVPGDYDGDGVTDIANWNPSNGKWYIKGSSGQNLFPTWGGPGLLPVPGDYDGDKVTDVAVWNPTIGKWYIKGSKGQNLFRYWGGPTNIPVSAP